MTRVGAIAFGMLMGVATLAFAAVPGWANGWSSHKSAYGAGAGGYAMLGHGGKAHGFANHLLRHRQELGLTEEQVGKLKSIALQQDLAAIRAHADVRVAARELRALVSDEKTDLSVIEAKVNEQEGLEGKLRMIGIKAKREASAVLTPEQREKHQTLRRQMWHGYRSRMIKADTSRPANDGASSEKRAADRESDNQPAVNQAG
ncbi:MAG: Spy/CpxP family protein refolding chaperone [Nitrospiraceae bacterium]